jgi:TonB-dependent starch-binding outer membrane protein SusC
MKKRLQGMLTLLLVLVVQIGFAQQKTVSGTVVDEEGLPLPGVNVIEKGTRNGTQTNFDGEYSLTVAEGQSLVYSYVGFTTQEVIVGSSNVLDIVLNLDRNALEEVVITGYTTSSKRKATSASSLVGAEEIETVPIASFEQILQGRAPGLLVNSGSGQPGTSAKVRIRGTSSINGNNSPLYIVDGIPIDEGSFKNLNPNDFESVSVLKDAQASALYGSRAGAGVIVITTKSGNYNAETAVTYRSQIGFSEIPEANIETFNAQQYYEFNRLRGANNYTDAEIAALVAETDTDWKEYIFRTGVTNSQEVNVTGGSDKTKFYTSLSYYDQDGVIITSKLQRFSVKGNLEHKVSDRLSIGMNNTMAFSKSNFINSENGVNLNNVALYAYMGNPTQALYDEDGNFLTGSGRNAANYIERQQTGINQDDELKIVSSAFANLKLNEKWSLNYRLGMDFEDEFSVDAIDPATFVGGTITPGQSGRQSESSFRRFKFNSTLQLRYANTFAEKHSVDASAFVEYYKEHFRSSSFTGYGLEPALFGYANSITAGTVDNGLIPTVGGGVAERGLFSVFGSATYDYDNRYGLDFSVRNDKSSRFSDANKEATFYSVGARWNLDEESFLRNSDVVTELKLRGSYGTSGNERSIADFSYLQQLGRTLYQGEDVLTIGGLPNSNLKWEVIKQGNIGLDFGFFENKLNGSLDLYDKRATDLFVSYTIPSGYGDTSVLANEGVMQNKGIELGLSYDLIRGEDFNVNVFGNASYNKNEILDLGQVNEFEFGTSIVRVGEAFNAHYEVEYAGVNPSNGEPLYYDLDGNVTNIYSSANRKTGYGSPEPIYTGGFGANIQYKGFELSTLFTFAAEYFRYNNQSFFLENPSFAGAFNQSVNMLDVWQQPGDITDIPGLAYARDFSSRDIEDASYLKFRNLTLAYNLKENLLGEKAFIKGARIYLQGVNLATWTEYTGFDPEDNDNIAQFEYPTPRTITAGVDLNF